MYIRKSISGNYGGLADQVKGVDPKTYIPKQLPTVGDVIAAQVVSKYPAQKLTRNYPINSKPYWTNLGPEMLTRKTANAVPLTIVPAPLSGLEEVKAPAVVLGLFLMFWLLK